MRTPSARHGRAAAPAGARRAARVPPGLASPRASSVPLAGSISTSPVAAVERHERCPAGCAQLASCRPTTAGIVERPRQDGRVVRPAAGVGGEPAHLGPVDLRGHRRRQLVGRPARTVRRAPRSRSRGVATPCRRFMRSRPTTSATSPFRSRRYGSATSSNTALSSSKACCTAHSAFTRCVADELCGPGEQHRVVQHQQLRVEQRRQLAAAGLATRSRDARCSCSPRALAGRLQPVHLLLDPRGRHPVRAAPARAGSARPRAPTTTPGDTPIPVSRSIAVSSPKPDATSAASASTASCSSAPSAVMVTAVPRGAASSSMPMMLLPSTSRSPARHAHSRLGSRVAGARTSRRRARACRAGSRRLSPRGVTRHRSPGPPVSPAQQSPTRPRSPPCRARASRAPPPAGRRLRAGSPA